MLDNPLDDTARKAMLPRYSFLLMISFEGAVKLGNWKALKGIIDVLLFAWGDMTGVGCRCGTSFVADI
jgi:hypothetical protein